MNRRGFAAAGVAAALLLAGCSSLPKAPPAVDSLSGRLSVRVDDEPPRSVSATFELRGDAQAGELDLTSPLGSIMARASWAPGRVELETPDRRARYSDLDTMSRDALGETLPLSALFDWLRGRPWPGAASEPIPGEAGFTQLGWTVRLARFTDGWVDAHRPLDPPVTVRARIDR